MSSAVLRVLCALLIVAMVAAAFLIPWVGLEYSFSDDSELNALQLYKVGS